MRIGIIAGEASGDLLGAGLIKAIKELMPDTVFEGIGGPKMIEQGCHSLYKMERLSVMGLIEPLGRFRELLNIRKQSIQHFIDNPPDVFIGIDAPDFNFHIEKKLKNAGIRTVHYVSPSIWAWREYRIKKILRSTDLMLALFPFEVAFYEKHGLNVRYVGHPSADTIAMEPDVAAARQLLNLPESQPVLAILPGSRVKELHYLVDDFLKAARLVHEAHPQMRFIAPMANEKTRSLFEASLKQQAPMLPVTIINGNSHKVMEAADYVLLASGTAALEAMLLKKPMVACYRVSPVTAFIVRLFRMIKVSHFTLPNLLSGDALVTELIQEAVTPTAIASALEQLINHPDKVEQLKSRFHDIHVLLRQNASMSAAKAIIELVNGKAKGDS